MRYFMFCLSLFLGCAASGQLQAAEIPASLQTLFNRIPKLPDTIAAATRWVDGNGELVAPQLLQLTADLDAQKNAVSVIANSRNGAVQEQAMAQMDSLNQGMASAGIDVQRMQSDPAYARQMQDRMHSMSPQELMALSQEMSQPMQNNPRIPNEAQLLANDSPAVQRASEAGAAYNGAQVQRIQASEAIWQQAATDAKQLQAQPYNVKAARPRSDWDDVSCDKACQAQWDAYVAQVLPLLESRANQVLQIQQKALQQHRDNLASAVAEADRHMQATAFGADAKSQLHLARITGYDTAVVGDMEQLLDHLRRSVEQAAYVKQCGTQMIRSPHAICQRNPS